MQVFVGLDNAEHALPGLQSLRGVAEPVLDVAVPQPVLAGVRLELQQMFQMLPCQRVLLLGGGDQREAFDGAHVIGQGVEGGLEARGRVVVAAHAIEGAAEVDTEVGVVRGGADGVLEAGGGE